jgi:hypothetical protein
MFEDQERSSTLSLQAIRPEYRPLWSAVHRKVTFTVVPIAVCLMYERNNTLRVRTGFTHQYEPQISWQLCEGFSYKYDMTYQHYSLLSKYDITKKRSLIAYVNRGLGSRLISEPLYDHRPSHCFAISDRSIKEPDRPRDGTHYAKVIILIAFPRLWRRRQSLYLECWIEELDIRMKRFRAEYARR